MMAKPFASVAFYVLLTLAAHAGASSAHGCGDLTEGYMKQTFVSSIKTYLGLAPRCEPRLEDIAKETFLRFVETFTYPNNEEVLKKNDTDLFAEDVIGTVDISENYDSKMLACEYFFGMFAYLALSPTDPALIGSPVKSEVTGLVIKDGVVAARVLIDFYFAVLNQSYPLQIDGYYTINPQGQITRYDMTLRRFAQLSELVTPLLLPHMAAAVNVTSTNGTFILQQYLATRTCQGHDKYCTGSYQQYDNYDSCFQFLQGLPIGEAWEFGQNNLECRYLHTAMLSTNPYVHCPHVGPTGGDMCIQHGYEATVLAPRFGNAFVAS